MQRLQIAQDEEALKEKGSYSWNNSVHIKNGIPDGVIIELRNGDLTIDGSIGANVLITIYNDERDVKRQRKIRTVTINGDIGENSKIECKESVNVIFNGQLGASSKINVKPNCSISGKNLQTSSKTHLTGFFASSDKKGRYYRFEHEEKQTNCFCQVM